MSAVPTAAAGLDAVDAGLANDAPRPLRRLARRPVAIVCLVYLALLVLVAIIAPVALPSVNHEDAGSAAFLGGPSHEHLLGTDSVGRDVLGRLLVGTRVTLLSILLAVAVATVISVPLGLISGYFGGTVDRVIARLVELLLSMPGIVVLLVVLTVYHNNTVVAMATLGVLGAPSSIRILRAAVLPVREELYIDAARVAGLSHAYIIRRHVLPRVVGPIIISSALFAAGALIAQAGLAFLGLLVKPPAASWGGMLADGMQSLVQQPWLIWPPGVTIALTTLAFGLLGDEVRDVTAESWQDAVRRARRGRLRARLRRPARRGAPAAPLPRDTTVGASALVRPDALLAIERLSVVFPSADGSVPVVQDVTFDIARGETVGLVGESGCGKTMTAMAILGLLRGNGRIAAGRVGFDGRDLAALPERELRHLRGKEIALISQEPMVALNPAFRVGQQLEHCLRVHQGLSRRAARERALALLERVRLPDPEAVARRYPHQLSGGMAQRVAIARALCGDPKLLIADEPTTALDVTVQAEILDLLRELAREQGMAILLVTHDWGVVADLCDRAVVMYAGQVVERAAISPLFRAPSHPYTEALLSSNPHHAAQGEPLATIPGGVPRPGAWPTGCHFHPRCSYATDACRAQAIPLERPAEGRETRCIHHEELVAK